MHDFQTTKNLERLLRSENNLDKLRERAGVQGLTEQVLWGDSEGALNAVQAESAEVVADVLGICFEDAGEDALRQLREQRLVLVLEKFQFFGIQLFPGLKVELVAGALFI